MKKYLLLVLLPLLLCSSCIDPYDLPLKTYKSESPYIYISCQTPLRGGYKGEVADENGEIVEVIAEFHHGTFSLYKYISDGPDGLGEELLRGDFRYREKENILIFYCDNGDEITLIPIEESPSDASASIDEANTP